MKKYTKEIIICLFAVAVMICCTCIAKTYAYADSIDSVDRSSIEYEPFTFAWQEYGYTNVIECHNDLINKKKEIVGAADSMIEHYSPIITDEEKELLYTYEDKMVNAYTITRYQEYLSLFNSLCEQLNEELESYLENQYNVESVNVVSSHSNSNSGGGYYVGNGSGLTKSGGVNYFNGRKETWYSSNILYHYQTPEWTVDSNGVYRDADGYVVVAAGDYNKGDVIETSHGAGKVYDACPTPGVTDIYTQW